MTKYYWLSALILLGAACGDDDGGTDASSDMSVGVDGSVDLSVPDAEDGSIPDRGVDGTVVPDATADATPDATPDGNLPSPGCGTAIPSVRVNPFMDSYDRPVFMTQAPGGDAFYVVEQHTGKIHVISNGNKSEFLDLGAEIRTGNEEGLLGLAFHPDYGNNGRFFVFYVSSGNRRNVVAEYARSNDPLVADANEVRRLVEPRDSESNHNGGMIAFGPDGFLYVGFGDEGGGGDGHGTIGNGLDKTTLFGSILRLDVDNAAGDFAAAGNPFTGAEQTQIWAYGLRNPWRFSFDSENGDLWIGDVGQGGWEEIDHVAAGQGAGFNFGWRAYEGFEVFNNSNVNLVPDHAEPVAVYPHSRQNNYPIQGCSVTGGYVYRGTAIPELRGAYIYGDYCSGEVAAIRLDANGDVCQNDKIDSLTSPNLSSFAEDADGELYILAGGNVLKIAPN